MGLLTDSRECLRRMLSRCHALQTWQGATYTETQLLARIYANAIPDPPGNAVEHTLEALVAMRPYILVGINPQSPLALRRDAIGSDLGSCSPNGSLLVMLEQNAVGSSESAIDNNFESLIDGMLLTGNPSQPGLIDQLGQADSLTIRMIMVEGIYRIQPEEVASKGDAQRAYIRVDWGYA